MPAHTTNYRNTLIEIAEDCPVNVSENPVAKGDKITVAIHQFDKISAKPYHYTSDDVIFEWYAMKNDLTESELPEARRTFFSKGQPCLRTSPLAKRYGWGIHSNEEGKIAIYAVESSEYVQFMNDSSVKKVRAMRSKRG